MLHLFSTVTIVVRIHWSGLHHMYFIRIASVLIKDCFKDNL